MAAALILPFETAHVKEPAGNLAGVRGVGEGGTLGPAAVLANAVADVLAPLGVEPDELPLSPARVRRACKLATRREGAEEGDPAPPAQAPAASRSRSGLTGDQPAIRHMPCYGLNRR